MFSFDRLYRTCEPKKSRNQRGLDFLCFCSSCDITDPPPPHTEQFTYILTGGVCACRPVCCSSCRLRVCGCFQPSCWILIELLRRQQTVSSDHRLNCRWTRSFKAAADSQIFYSFIQQMHRPSTFFFLVHVYPPPLRGRRNPPPSSCLLSPLYPRGWQHSSIVFSSS